MVFDRMYSHYESSPNGLTTIFPSESSAQFQGSLLFHERVPFLPEGTLHQLHVLYLERDKIIHLFSKPIF